MKKKRLSKEEESHLISECLKNNRYELLFEQYWVLVRSTIERTFIAKNFKFDEDDILNVQVKTFDSLINNLHKYEPKEGSTLSAYIITIATNRAINYVRDMFQRGAVVLIDDDALNKIMDSCNISKKIEARLILIKIEELLKIMRLRESKVFILHYQKNKDIPTIAFELNISEDAVRSALTRARKFLRDELNL
ncbi:RNA polymerase sigma-70 domain protein [Candidatus Magnetomorum sp. HK-1]|nr:RNA polymerase sigma-70 domain protein [Candidatus Magnetomorum sp. HK-1]